MKVVLRVFVACCFLMSGLTACEPGFAQKGIMKATGADEQTKQRQERLKAEQEEQRQQNLTDASYFGGI
jgi:hypothetical protein